MSNSPKKLVETVLVASGPKLADIPGLKSAVSPHFTKDPFFRYVNNYDFCFRTFAKQRWLGRKLIEVFTSEFKAFTEAYYVKALSKERILVNGTPVTGEYVIKNSDKIEHYTVRRELPVYNLPIVEVYRDEEMIGVDKPPSLPVHPCGAYNKNSLVRIMELEDNMNDWHPIHRLDKLTSGLLILVKGKANTLKYQRELKENNVHKKYLARISGRLPQPKLTVDTPIYCVSEKHSKHGVATSPEAIALSKEALTRFEEVWYDEKTDTSLVECFPLTGRTHQIRVHLQSIKCSIINDVNYGGRKVGNLCLFKLRKEHPEEFHACRVVKAGRLMDGKQLMEQVQLERILDQAAFSEPKEMDIPKNDETLDKSNPEIFQGKRALDENGLDMPLDATDGASKLDPPAQKKLVIGQGITVTKAVTPNPDTVLVAEDEESDEMEMKMFFNYGDLDELPYTPYNEDRMMEIWLHSSTYVIKGKTLKSNDPYWVSKDLVWEST